MSASRVPFTSTNASVLLDLIRGLAALLVCLEHWRNLLYVDYGQIAVHRTLFAVPYVLTDAGHQAVVIFFVLSGYLISGNVFRMVERGTWSWPLYLTHRLVRLWIVLIPALVLGAALDFSGLHLGLAPALYAGQTGTHMMPNVADSLHPGIFAGNLLFLQGFAVRVFGSNVPLWSLSNEFWYYILFPCAFLALRRGTPVAARIVNAAVFLLSAWFVSHYVLQLFPLWLLGTVLAAIPAPKVNPMLRIAAVIVYAPLLFFLSKTSLVSGVSSDYILGIATFVFIWLLLGARSAASASRWISLTRLTARFSYTLYLVHVPFLVLLTALIVGNGRWQPEMKYLAYGAGILLLAIGYAYVVASLTEFRTNRVRSWVEARLLGRMLRDKKNLALKS
jgi:peptidoglycan/LPS O-acetylase OafA/YrhL